MNKINKIRTRAIAIALLCACFAGKSTAQPTLQTPTMTDNTWYSSSSSINGLNTAAIALGPIALPSLVCGLVDNDGSSSPNFRVMDPINGGGDIAPLFTGVIGTPDVAIGNWNGRSSTCSTCYSIQTDVIAAVAFLNSSNHIQVNFYDVYDDGAGTDTIGNMRNPIATTTLSGTTYLAQTVHIDIVAERGMTGSMPYCNEFIVTWDDYSGGTPAVYAQAGSLSSLAFSGSLATISSSGHSPDVAAIQYLLTSTPGIDYYGLITYVDASTNNQLLLNIYDFSVSTSASGPRYLDSGLTSTTISNPRIDAFDDYLLNDTTSMRGVYKIVAQVDSYNTGATKVIRSYDNIQSKWPVSSYVNVSSTAGIAGVSVYTAVPVWQYNNYAPTVAALQQTFPVAHEMEYDPSTPGSDIVFMEPVLSPLYNNFLFNDYYFVNSLTTSSGGLTIAPQAMNAYGTYASAICTPANYEVYGNYTLVTWAQQSGTGYDIKYKESTVPFAFRTAPSSVGAVQAGKWRVYPNPATDDLVVAAENSQTATVYNIADMAGRTLLQGTLLQQTAGIAVSTLPPGTYLLRLDGNGSTWQSLFVKK